MTSFITAAHPESTSLTHDTNRLRLISGTSNTALAKEIATYMGITNVPLVSKKRINSYKKELNKAFR